MKNLISLMLLISFGSVGAIFFTPGLPEISTFFDISTELSSLTVTLYLIGYAVGLLIYGPMANSLGSKDTIITGSLIALFGTIICIISGITHLFFLLIVGRIITAVGACSGLKMAFNLSAFMYPKEKLASIVALLTMAFAIMPAIGIFLSGFLVKNFGWISSFYLMILYCILIFCLSYYLPEVYKKTERKNFKLSSLINDYTTQFKDKSVFFSGLLVGTCSGIFYAFSATAPFIAIKMMGISPEVYGMYNLIPSAALIAGSLIASYFGKILKQKNSIKIGLYLVFISTLILLIMLVSFKNNPFSLFLPVALIYIGVSFIYGNSVSIGLEKTFDKSNASSIIGFLNMSSACLIMLFLGKTALKNAIMLPIVYIILVALGFIWYTVLTKNLPCDRNQKK